MVVGDADLVGKILHHLSGQRHQTTAAGGVDIATALSPRSATALRSPLPSATPARESPPTGLESLFGLFHPGDGSTTRRHGGTGIGPAIARRAGRKPWRFPDQDSRPRRTTIQSPPCPPAPKRRRGRPPNCIPSREDERSKALSNGKAKVGQLSVCERTGYQSLCGLIRPWGPGPLDGPHRRPVPPATCSAAIRRLQLADAVFGRNGTPGPPTTRSWTIRYCGLRAMKSALSWRSAQGASGGCRRRRGLKATIRTPGKSGRGGASPIQQKFRDLDMTEISCLMLTPRSLPSGNIFPQGRASACFCDRDHGVGGAAPSAKWASQDSTRPAKASERVAVENPHSTTRRLLKAGDRRGGGRDQIQGVGRESVRTPSARRQRRPGHDRVGPPPPPAWGRQPRRSRPGREAEELLTTAADDAKCPGADEQVFQVNRCCPCSPLRPSHAAPLAGPLPAEGEFPALP